MWGEGNGKEGEGLGWVCGVGRRGDLEEWSFYSMHNIALFRKVGKHFQLAACKNFL